MNKKTKYFTNIEKILWLTSIAFILSSFLLFDRENYLTLTASIIGATSLIFIAKGNFFGQLLMIVFSLLYGIISYTFQYYGEMITYLGMTAPMAVFSLISWLKNPFNGKKSEVKVNKIKKSEVSLIILLTVTVTIIFYFILKELNTSNLLASTISVTTSFIAVYLSFRRSVFYALAYAANDIILIILWFLAFIHDSSYISVAVCFVMFFVNDIYGYISWAKMQKRQYEYENRHKKSTE